MSKKHKQRQKKMTEEHLMGAKRMKKRSEKQ